MRHDGPDPADQDVEAAAMTATTSGPYPLDEPLPFRARPVPAYPSMDAGGFFRRYLRDLVYGALDGIITTFAVVAGVAGARLPTRVVLIMGVANLVADGISMGASNYLGIRSERAARDAHDGPAPWGTAHPEVSALRHGGATVLAFVSAGSVPLASYLLPLARETRFAWAVVLTLVALFVVGAVRSGVTKEPAWKSGLEMLAVGAGAAAVAYGAGHVIGVLTATGGVSV